MEKKMIALVLILGIFVPLNSATANQYGITVGATTDSPSTVSVNIPAGTYHVFITIDAYLGYSVTASCDSDILSISISGDETFPYTFESVLTVDQGENYTFTAAIDTTYSGYFVNFAVILTDLDVETLTKSNVISEAPYAFEIITLALAAVAFIYIQKRRHK